jgi:hypothetical protein
MQKNLKKVLGNNFPKNFKNGKGLILYYNNKVEIEG